MSSDKELTLREMCSAIRRGTHPAECFDVEPEQFTSIPGSPFPYWSSENLRKNFQDLPPFEFGTRCARVGLQTSDDFRFVRTAWEVLPNSLGVSWLPFVRGGGASKYLGVLSLLVKWKNDGHELKSWASIVNNGQHWSRNIRSPDFYKRPGVTWPLRAAELSPYPMPTGSVFSVRGAVAFEAEERLLPMLGLMASKPFDYLFKLLLGRFGHPEFGIGALQKVPVPNGVSPRLGELAKSAYSMKLLLKMADETSHTFHLPARLLERGVEFDQISIDARLVEIQAEIDEIAFRLYGFNEADRSAALGNAEMGDIDEAEGSGDPGENDNEDSKELIDQTDALLSWAVGVAVGRFDWRLATGEREAPPEPGPFDPLPAKSPGMLPDGAAPFRAHGGILVDDQGHPHDLPRLIEEILARVQVDVPGDVRSWLQRDFFPLHLKQYSKSRRKAPIYWPLSTDSGSYTLWLYYPSLTSQSLYTAVNDFVEPKLKQVGRDAAALRDKGGARSREAEKAFEALQSLELELTELRDTLLQIAPTYRPNHDDGVQITAAPLWQLFRQRPWQKILKDTWAKLEKGDYDWAHLAMANWPDRVHGKCKMDKSLAIAHDFEHLYELPEPKANKPSGRKHSVSG
jgi:hypothetical protein